MVAAWSGSDVKEVYAADLLASRLPLIYILIVPDDLDIATWYQVFADKDVLDVRISPSG